MTLGKIASLDQFSKRLRVAVRASVLWGDLGRDHSIHYTRGILMDLSSKSWIPAARLNTQVGVWKWTEGGEMLLERALHVGTPPSLPRGKAWMLPPYLKVCDGGFLRTTYWAWDFFFYCWGKREVARLACGSRTQRWRLVLPSQGLLGQRMRECFLGLKCESLGRESTRLELFLKIYFKKVL